MVTETAINIAKSYVAQLPREMAVKKAYLFGSYARGSQSDNSDIDVAIIIGSMNDIFDLQMEMLRIRRKIDLRIEPHPIKEKDFSPLNPFADEIMRSGIEIFNE
jgi:predicted nucleotidyltransferase